MFKILILGDICYTKDYQELFSGQNPDALFNNLLPVMQKSDLCIANLEAPVIEEPSPLTKCGPTLEMYTNHIELLEKAGIKVVSIANNHILDHGEKGLKSTLNICRSHNIETIGAGLTPEEIEKEHIVEFEQMKIAVISYAEKEFNYLEDKKIGANIFNPYKSIDKIRELKDFNTFVFVLYHGGIEHYPYPSPDLQQSCRAIVEAGADIVLCQHSHCIGTIENYKSSTILYGQGNSVFGYREKEEEWNKGLVVTLNIERGKKLNIDFIPIIASKNGIDIMEAPIAKEVMTEIKKKSLILKNQEEIEKKWKKFCKNKKALYLSHLLGRNRIFNKINRILSNRLITLLYSKKKLMIIKNLLQCSSHKELLLTILEEETKYL